MGYRVNEIEGIGPAYAEKLSRAGIETTDDLLEVCAEPQGRRLIGEKAELSEKHLLRWANLADLMRISGIGPQYSELLEAAGVDTVKELRTRNAENLTTTMEEINGVKKLARTSPGLKSVQGWIGQAATIEPKIRH